MPPAGFKRSRALWDEARRPRDRKVEEWKSLLRAILYELQPVRFSQYKNQFSLSSIWKTHVLPTARQVVSVSGRLFPRLWSLLCNMTSRHWMIVGGIVLYYLVVRWIHELIHAGPVVLISTALAIIFTVGLGDNENDGELSAYSVFNRGFQRLMGSVDVEELVNQHVGGGMMMGAAGMHPPPPLVVDDDQEHRRQERPQQPRQNHDNANHNQQNDDNNNEQQQPQPQNNRKKAGKKERRRNLEEREDRRRQREAARAMGLDGAGGEQEIMAMQRLIEDQVAAAAAQNGE